MIAATNNAIVMIFFLALSITLQGWFPLIALTGLAARLLGLAVFLAGMAIALAIYDLMRQARRMPEAHRRRLGVNSTGPYRLSRNPFYLSLLLQYAGIGIMLETLWALLLLPAIILLINRWTIIPQEHELEVRYGEEYRRYKNRVRRWL